MNPPPEDPATVVARLEAAASRIRRAHEAEEPASPTVSEDRATPAPPLGAHVGPTPVALLTDLDALADQLRLARAEVAAALDHLATAPAS